MKNNKGFTLTELLVVIVILLSVTSGTIFGLQKIQNNSEEKRLKELIKEIEMAADIYINSHPAYMEDLLNTNEKKCIRLYVLQREGLVDINLVNPVTGQNIPANLCVYSEKDADGVIENTFNIDYEFEE